ncbi:MAG: cupin domain-containing protein [Gemmatimonadetes bacterium]|nr:cupin domain-containing protein [Gemmatimonadota bacterium]
MSSPKILHARDDKRTVHAAGDVYRYLATGAETNATYFMMHALIPPGGGPPPHIQTREEEGFYVLDGRVTFWVDGQREEVEGGAFLHVPRGVPHNFKNESDSDATMLIWFAPAGIEKMFDEMAADPDGYREIAGRYGVEFVDEE